MRAVGNGLAGYAASNCFLHTIVNPWKPHLCCADCSIVEPGAGGQFHDE